jgi:hypothetical protein
MSAKYRDFSIYLRNVIIDAGCIKPSGDPNIAEFFDKYKVEGISHSTLQNLVRGAKNEPYGRTLDALSVMLSTATNTRITTDYLIALCRNPSAVEEIEEELDESLFPDELDREKYHAKQLMEKFMALSLNARATVAPELMEKLAQDWRFLDEDGYGRVMLMLKSETERAGLGLERWRQKYAAIVDPEKLARLRDGDKTVRLKKSEVVALAAVLTWAGETMPVTEFAELYRGG